MKRVGLRAGSWSIDGLALVEGFRERWRGAKLPHTELGVMIRTSAVHTMGMSERLELFSVGKDHRVVERRSLVPNRFAWFRGARYVVELPAGSDVPAAGARVEIFDAG